MSYTASQGRNWVWITGLATEERTVGWLAASFARAGKFRIEVYLDARDVTATKAIFDRLLAERTVIENTVASPLEWERLDAKRASRIARYWPARITDSSQKLERLRADAVEVAGRLYAATSEVLVSMPPHIGT